MALKMRKSITVNADVMIGQNSVASLAASIESSGTSSVNLNITNSLDYNANRAAVRADIAAFYDEVYAAEDMLAEEASDAEVPTE